MADVHGENRLGRGSIEIQIGDGETAGRIRLNGTFGSWKHAFRILPHEVDARVSILEDRVDYRVASSGLPSPAARARAERELVRTFDYRHRVIGEDLRRHAESSLFPSTIAVTGSTGFIGRALVAFLTGIGHRVVRVVRSLPDRDRFVRSDQERAAYWRPSRGFVEDGAFDGVDAVIHLAGEPLFRRRWTRRQMARILDSRARSTRILSETLAAMEYPPRVLLSASGSSYYGDRGHDVLNEASPPGSGFLSDVCRAWEDATLPASAAGIRVCNMRFGAVLSPTGGILGDVLPLLRMGVGGISGRGRAWVPWIALDDVLYAVLHLLAADNLHGPFNVAAPHPVSQHRLVETLGAALGRWTPLRVPRALISLAVGTEARRAFGSSVRMVPEHLANSGFSFAYPHLTAAFEHLLGRPSATDPDSLQ